MKNIQLSIVVPAYREAERITDSLEKLSKAIKEYLDAERTEVIVVSADSTDNTAEVAEKSKHLFRHFSVVKPGPRVGKGRDVRSGIQAASGQYRMFMDADMATPLHHLQDVKKFIDSNGEVGIGVRPLSNIHTGLRKYISEFGNILVRTLLTPGINDSQCGFKVFRADCAEVMFSRLTILSWGFDMELLTIARVHKYTIKTFVIDDWHDPKAEGLVGDSSIKVALQTGIDLLLILKNRLIGRYR